MAGCLYAYYYQGGWGNHPRCLCLVSKSYSSPTTSSSSWNVHCMGPGGTPLDLFGGQSLLETTQSSLAQVDEYRSGIGHWQCPTLDGGQIHSLRRVDLSQRNGTLLPEPRRRHGIGPVLVRHGHCDSSLCSTNVFILRFLATGTIRSSIFFIFRIIIIIIIIRIEHDEGSRVVGSCPKS